MLRHSNTPNDKKSLDSQLSDAVTGAQLVFLSDVHLRHHGSDRRWLGLERVLSALIHSLSSSPRELSGASSLKVILGGDIFDFHWGSGRYFAQKAQPLWQKLSGLVTSGAQVYFLTGNHEFCLQNYATGGE